ncbi:MAG: hypothetical protein HN531_12285 [Opitutae bacterium]|nr:hypothetical protein [Opitutae bacterium]
MGNSIFAEAKPLPDFNAGSMNWGTQRYKFTLIKNGKKIELGSAIIRNELKDDRVILTDEYLVRYKGKPMSLNMKLVCRKDQYLSPLKIECKGKGSDEMPTFKAIIKDGDAKISGEWNKTMKIPKGTVTSAAFLRIVSQLPRVQGATFRYDFALEAGEMHLKGDYIAKVIGKETIFCDGEPVKCWKISQNGGGISEQLFWVNEDGILQRVLQDGRKQIDLQKGEPGD